MNNVVNQMKALGDSNRFRISMMLMERSLCVCELLEVLDIAGGTLSNHLKILKNAGLIDQRKDGKWVEYFIADEKARTLLKSLLSYIDDTAQIDEDRKIITAINRTVCSVSGKRASTLKAIQGLQE